jgi:hypothetical protein
VPGFVAVVEDAHSSGEPLLALACTYLIVWLALDDTQLAPVAAQGAVFVVEHAYSFGEHHLGLGYICLMVVAALEATRRERVAGMTYSPDEPQLGRACI